MASVQGKHHGTGRGLEGDAFGQYPSCKPDCGSCETVLLGSEFTLDVALPCSVLHFFFYRISDKLFPSSKECCENLGSISCLDMMRMEVKCPCKEEVNAELLCLCEVRAALAWYKEFRETECEEEGGR